MFGFNLGGGSAGVDRGRALSGWQDQWTNLREERNQYDKTYPGAQSALTSAMSNMGLGGDFWKGVLSSTPTAAGVMAPEVNQVNAQSDAAKTAEANLGTARTGGTSGGNQQRQMTTQGLITNAIFGARPAAAQQVTQVGQQEGQLGNEQLMNALRALGMSDENIRSLINSSLQSRQQDVGIRQGNLSNIMKAVSAVAGGFGGGGGFGGTIDSGNQGGF